MCFLSLISALHYLNDYKMRVMLSEYVTTSLCCKKMTVVSELQSHDAFVSKYKSHLIKNFNIFENHSISSALYCGK
jgi:hypothetical protein